MSIDEDREIVRTSLNNLLEMLRPLEELRDHLRKGLDQDLVNDPEWNQQGEEMFVLIGASTQFLFMDMSEEDKATARSMILG